MYIRNYTYIDVYIYIHIIYIHIFIFIHTLHFLFAGDLSLSISRKDIQNIPKQVSRLSSHVH